MFVMAKKTKKPARKLTSKQEAFCRYKAEGKSNTDAAKLAGYSEKMAYSIGTENTKKPHIKKRIKELQAPAVKKAEITVERVFQELATIAFLDHEKITDAKGNYLPVHKLPENVRRALSGLSFDRYGRPKYTFHSKTKALELLGKTNILNMFIENIRDLTDRPVTDESLMKARKDLAKDIAKELKK